MSEPTSPEQRPPDPDNLPINPEQARPGDQVRGAHAPRRDQEPVAGQTSGHKEQFAPGWDPERLPRGTWDELDRVGVSKSDIDTWIQIKREQERTGRVSPENEILNAHIVEKLGLLEPAKQREVMNIMLEETRQPDMVIPEISPESNREEQSAEEQAASEAERRAHASALQAQSAVQSYLQNDKKDLDVDLRDKANEAIRKAREDADHEKVHHYHGKEPKWVKALTALGLTFYAIVAMQYAVASAAEKMMNPKR